MRLAAYGFVYEHVTMYANDVRLDNTGLMLFRASINLLIM